jgi:hypothetical protein
MHEDDPTASQPKPASITPTLNATEPTLVFDDAAGPAVLANGYESDTGFYFKACHNIERVPASFSLVGGG